MEVSVGRQPKGQLWLVLAVLVAFAMLGEAARSLPPPSLSASPTYAPIIKVIGKAYCYRCFNEAHPEESHGKEHLEGNISVICSSRYLRTLMQSAWKYVKFLLVHSYLA
uniref:Uncharacterized protein n=1 Tax=Aegilops tauschii subsp. strangulata TaxID=200361 RepID=A0A453G4F3_AEGTS